uniref:Mobile element protein n=1 Tax=Ascaris lumbricoides TaxID=6252 RepID=A0A0M3HKU7_ASCLU
MCLTILQYDNWKTGTTIEKAYRKLPYKQLDRPPFAG